jgi:CheY-like chemotaxis protein
MSSSTIRVLIVDDEPDKQLPLRNLLQKDINIEVQHPDDVTLESLKNTVLVLVDLYLNEWEKREALERIAFQPKTGLALAAVLRAHVQSMEGANPTAFAIHSAHLSTLAGDLPTKHREHILAQTHNLEWAFAKNSRSHNIPLHQQIVSLAKAVTLLPKEWPVDDDIEMQNLVCELLQLNQENASSWVVNAWEDIESCHPPVHDLYKSTHGLAFLRWMLHKILPYPCFLRDSRWLAARLRVTHNSLSKALASSAELNKLLEPYRYGGMLSGFLGNHWWRAGIESLVWDITDGKSFNVELARQNIVERTSIFLDALPFNRAVICIDEEHQVIDEPIDIDKAVRIVPDDWPPYAEDAWTTIELAENNPALSALVTIRDRERISS